jgi:hypothetical protein
MGVIPLTVQTSRRRVPRQVQRHQVSWHVTEINGKSVRDSWMVDVSCMGARLDTAAALSPNMPVQFTVVLPDGKTELEVNGRVIWMRPVFATRGRYHQRIEFSGINCEVDRLARKESPG